MPRYDDENMEIMQGGKGFTFSAVKIEKLGAQNQTLIDFVVDITGSTLKYKTEIYNTLQVIIHNMKGKSYTDNILVRITVFNDTIGIKELFGFKPLSLFNFNGTLKIKMGKDEIEIDKCVDFSIDDINCYGMTNLVDAQLDAVTAVCEYSQKLVDNDFGVNGLILTLTDGEENASKHDEIDVRRYIENARAKENIIGQILMVLLGLLPSKNDPINDALEKFKSETGIDDFINAGELEGKNMEKIIKWIGQQISSVSSSLTTGGQSTVLNF